MVSPNLLVKPSLLEHRFGFNSHVTRMLALIHGYQPFAVLCKSLPEEETIMRIALLIAAMTLMISPANSQEDQHRWTITGAFTIGNNPSTICALQFPSGDGEPRLRLSNRTQPGATPGPLGSARLELIDLDGVTAAGAAESVAVSVEGIMNWIDLKGRWQTDADGRGRLVVYLDPDVRKVIAPLSRGYSVSIQVPGNEGRTYQYALNGSARALTKFQRCLD